MNYASVEEYNALVNARTLVSVNPFQSSRIKWTGYALFFFMITLLSGVSTYGYCYTKQPIVPVSCTESIYILKSGQSATCYDPRSRIDIVSNATANVAFMCKCSNK